MYFFVISAPWWETWWFRLIIAVAVVWLLWYIYNSRVQKLLAVERMRLRIASDLHDDIGATLTHISANSEIIKHNNDVSKIKESANKIGKLSREVIQTMSDIIWSIDSRNDSVEDLIMHMTDLANQLFIPKEIKFNIKHAGLNPSRKMDVDIRQNLYLIYREALNNIAKHSGADNVEVNLFNSKQYFSMIIKDNGKGIDKNQFAKGNGLKNIKMRTDRIHGKVQFKNDSGFQLELIIKSI